MTNYTPGVAISQQAGHIIRGVEQSRREVSGKSLKWGENGWWLNRWWLNRLWLNVWWLIKRVHRVRFRVRLRVRFRFIFRIRA